MAWGGGIEGTIWELLFGNKHQLSLLEYSHRTHELGGPPSLLIRALVRAKFVLIYAPQPGLGMNLFHDSIRITTSMYKAVNNNEVVTRARICRPFMELRNRFPAWRAGRTTLFFVLACKAT
jgi:hypothetical protein